MSTNGRLQLELDQFYGDIVKCSLLSEVPCNTEAIWKVLHAYEEYFKGGVVAIRPTTKPKEKRDMDVRYIDVQHPHDPYVIALERGLIVEKGHLVEKFFADVRKNFSVVGYGANMSVRHGLTKLWPMLGEPVPLNDLLKLDSLPSAVKNYADCLAKYQLQQPNLFAIDFYNKSINVYFMGSNPAIFTREKITELLHDFGCKVPSLEWLEISAHPADIHFTFTWDAPHCMRVSFANLHVSQEDFPVHLHPMFQRFFDEAPTLLPERRASIGTSFGPNDSNYLKYEIDYTGMEFAMRAATGQLS